MAHPKTIAFVLAGGKGERLFPLTAMRSKPAVPFGGRYRIIDFVLSNLINSRIYSIYLLVQYKSQSLIEHVRQNWVLSPVVKDQFIALVPPQMRMGPEWFQGTADAVFQNINLIQQHDPGLIVVFGADHIYRIDLRQMIDFHLDSNADATVAARPVPIGEASSFGVIVTDAENRIVEFQEKPKKPTPMLSDPNKAYVSLGNYVFGKEVLVGSLAAAQRNQQHDFGAHILPSLVKEGKRVFAYDFSTNVIPGAKPYEEIGYWRDVGTLEAYFKAHMDMLGEKPLFELINPLWPIMAGGGDGQSSKILNGEIINSLIADGIVIHGARVVNSIIRSNVVMEEGVSVEDSIIMDETVLKKNSKVKNAILDKQNILQEGDEIGFDPKKDRFNCHIDSSGIVVLPKGGRKKKTKA